MHLHTRLNIFPKYYVDVSITSSRIYIQPHVSLFSEFWKAERNSCEGSLKKKEKRKKKGAKKYAIAQCVEFARAEKKIKQRNSKYQFMHLRNFEYSFTRASNNDDDYCRRKKFPFSISITDIFNLRLCGYFSNVPFFSAPSPLPPSLIFFHCRSFNSKDK